MYQKYEKIGGGGGSLLAARTKGSRGLSLRGALATWQSSGSDLPIRQKVKCWFSKTNLQFLLTYSPTNLLTSKAFTMAEILLSLTIIGVVAAITLPSLTGNVNERVWNTQRKALYARFSQAISIMPALSGYGSYDGVVSDGSISSTTDTAAEAFLTDGLSKVLKINNICDNAHLSDCGVVTSYTNLVGSTNSFPTKLSELNNLFTTSYSYTNSLGQSFSNPLKELDTKAAAFETQNGETITLFYNPQCQPNLGNVNEVFVLSIMCANFIYDLNGNKGPNAVGKDIGFITALYASDPVIVAPNALATDPNDSTMIEQTLASAACTAQDSESRLPNIDELIAMFYNKDFVGITGGTYWSGSVISPSEALRMQYNTGTYFVGSREEARHVRCVKR